MKTILENDKDFICDIKTPCFQMLSNEEIEIVRSSRTQVIFRKGDMITKQGAFASYILFQITGFAKQYIEGDALKNYNLKIIMPGEFIGLSSVFTNNTFNYSSIALTDCQVYLIEKEAITNIIKQNGNFGLNIITRYCEQNSMLFSNLNNILFKQMNGRIADILIYLNNIKKHNPEIFNLLSRKDIADFAAISTESAVKLLKQFEKDKLIKLNEKDIDLLNVDAIKEISRRG